MPKKQIFSGNSLSHADRDKYNISPSDFLIQIGNPPYKVDSSIVVSMKELYKYAYLLTFKKLFQPIDMWLYGNLSPLGAEDLVEQKKKLFIKYLFITEKKALSRWDNQLKYKILKYYSLKNGDIKKYFQYKRKSLFIDSFFIWFG